MFMQISDLPSLKIIKQPIIKADFMGGIFVTAQSSSIL